MMEVLEILAAFLLVFVIPCQGDPFVVSPQEIERCGSQKTQSVKLTCTPTVRGITQVYAIEIGKISGSKKHAIARVTLVDPFNVVNVTSRLSSRLDLSGSISGQTGSLDVTLTNLEDSDASEYYCYISYLTNVLGEEHSTARVTIHTLNGSVATCNGTQVLDAISKHISVTASQAGKCPNGVAGRSEALLMEFCRGSGIGSWRSGKKVMDMCCQIPVYTPVATFEFGFYVQDERGMSGVFLECTPKGFKMATQLCGHPAINVTLQSNGLNGYISDADNYYIVDFNGAVYNPFG